MNEGEQSVGRVRYLKVGQEPGQRIDNFLLRELKGLPRSRIYNLLRKGEVRVNGGRVKPTHRLALGDEVRIPPIHGLPSGEAATAASAFIGDGILELLESAVIYEDAELLVINKPAGMPVHGGSGLTFGAIEALRRMRPDADLGLAHRLDRDTSGCLLVGKSRKVLLELHQALRQREVKKRYLLAVFGEWPRRVSTVQLSLERYQTASGERRVRVAADGKPSRTDFRVRERGVDATLLEAMLHTGRTHQIRVHARASRHAVVGDSKYSTAAQQARATELGIRRLCLHAEELVVVRGERKLKFLAPVPDDFLAAWQRLASAGP